MIGIIFGDKAKKLFCIISLSNYCIFHKLQNINAIKNKHIRKEILRDASKVYKSIGYEQYLQRKKNSLINTKPFNTFL